MRLATRISVNTLCALTLVGLAACGTDAPKETGPFAGQSGPQVANKALTATNGVKSLRIAVDMTTEDGRIKADFASSLAATAPGRCRWPARAAWRSSRPAGRSTRGSTRP